MLLRATPNPLTHLLPDISHSGNQKSLAYRTARTRWPKIIAAAIDDVLETNSQPNRGDTEIEDGRRVASDLENLLSDMQNDTLIRPLSEDGAADIQTFNDELGELGSMTWHNSPWLFTECYLYRQVQTCFSRRQTPFWKNYDVFKRQKSRALMSSKTSAVELVQLLRKIVDPSEHGHPLGESDLKALLEEMLEVSLWGNSVDLLLLVHLSTEELQSRQGKQARQSFKQNVVDDDMEEVSQCMSRLVNADRPREIHIILDNAGFEFLADLILATYLLAANYASAVVLHGKAFPWFISDVTAHDLEFTLKTLGSASFSDNVSNSEKVELKWFEATLKRHLQSGSLRFEAHPFWTTQHCYARMPEYAPDLWTELVKAELVVFKGDLNYRKLVFDGLWPRTTTFQQAIGELGKLPVEGRSGIRILALRTCKADTVVGLQLGREEEIDPNRTGEWTYNGKYAVISFFDGKG